jgi:hypothetical protein
MFSRPHIMQLLQGALSIPGRDRANSNRLKIVTNAIAGL